MPTRHLLYTFVAATAAVVLSTAAFAQKAEKKPATCVVVGKEVKKTKDMKCPQDVVGTLRSHFYEYEVPKMNKKGEAVLNAKGEVVMEKRRKTYKAMADLIEAVGLKKAFGKRLVTVFAVPDSVLMPALKDLSALLKDKKQKQQVFAAIAMHVTDEALMAEWFRSKNGRMWTFAGSWEFRRGSVVVLRLAGPHHRGDQQDPADGKRHRRFERRDSYGGQPAGLAAQAGKNGRQEDVATDFSDPARRGPAFQRTAPLPAELSKLGSTERLSSRMWYSSMTACESASEVE